MECKCKGWKKSAQQILELQAIAAITKRKLYTGKSFKFCPWCGKELDSKETPNESLNLTESVIPDSVG